MTSEIRQGAVESGNPLDTSGARDPEEEKRLNEEVIRITGATPESLGERDWISMRETLRLTLLYPGEYVVFRDFETGSGDDCRLARRDVPFHSPDLRQAQDYLMGLSEEEGLLYQLTFMSRDDWTFSDE